MTCVTPNNSEQSERIMDMAGSLSVPRPLARDEMDDTTFNTMIARGLNEAKADQSRAASDVFAGLREAIV